MADEAVEGTSAQTPAPAVTPVVESKGEETVSMTKYVGVKEMLGRTEGERDKAQATLDTTVEERDTLKEQAEVSAKQVESLQAEVKSLGEQIDSAPKSEAGSQEVEQLKAQLEGLKTMAVEARRANLVTNYGLPEEDVKAMGAEQLEVAEKVAGSLKGQVGAKPLPDMGSAPGGGAPEKARDKIRAGLDGLHP